MTYDEDGFICLQKIQNEFVELKKKDQPKPKKEKPEKKRYKFKKGSTKAWLYKRIQKFAFSKAIENFHNTRMENLTIYTKDNKPKVIRHNKKLDKSTISKLTSKYPNATVLIDGGTRFYERIPLESYLKLIQIRRVAIHFELISIPDGEEESMIVMDYDEIIDSINDLIHFHILAQNRSDTIEEIFVKYFWYDNQYQKYRIMVELKTGVIEYYKYINDFFTAYGLGVI